MLNYPFKCKIWTHFIPSQKGQHSPGILTGFWQLCLQAMAVQCGSPSTHWQKVQSSSFHCSSWALSLLFTQQLALVLSIDSSSTSEGRDTDMQLYGGQNQVREAGESLIWFWVTSIVWFGYHKYINPKLQSNVYTPSSTVTELTGDRVRTELKEVGYSMRELTWYRDWLVTKSRESETCLNWDDLFTFGSGERLKTLQQHMSGLKLKLDRIRFGVSLSSWERLNNWKHSEGDDIHNCRSPWCLLTLWLKAWSHRWEFQLWPLRSAARSAFDTINLTPKQKKAP